MSGDMMRKIELVRARAPSQLTVTWSDGTVIDLDLASRRTTRGKDMIPSDPGMFESVEVGDWGHSVRWPSGAEIGADALWLETLSQTGRADARAFLEWRLRHGLSLSKAAEALGLSRRMVAYYSNGEKPVPRPVLLACRGWEVDRAA